MPQTGFISLVHTHDLGVVVEAAVFAGGAAVVLGALVAGGALVVAGGALVVTGSAVVDGAGNKSINILSQSQLFYIDMYTPVRSSSN